MYEHKYIVLQAGKEVAQKFKATFTQGAEAYIKSLCGTNFVRYKGFTEICITPKEKAQPKQVQKI